MIGILTFVCYSQSTGGEKFKQRLPKVKVAVLYENITDGVLIDRSIDETINILKETRTDLIFRGFWKWLPIVNSPDSIPSELLELAPEGTTLEQAAEALRKSGYYYQELERWISAIKKEIPDIIFVGAIPTQTLSRIEYNPVTGKVYSMEETWGMALDPSKWGIKRNGKLVTKEQFQSWWYGVHPYGGKVEEYDWRKVPAYFPDITNLTFQDLLLSWAKKQIDCGADAIWIDMLYKQATLLLQMTRDMNHSSVRESVDSASKILDEIHKYGDSKGKYIYVGSWDGPFVWAEVAGLKFPYSPPNLDFITTSPLNQEILDMKLDSARWAMEISAQKKIYGNIPVFAFIDWAFDSSQTVMFSQKLSSEEQREVLRTFDSSFTKMGINFIYPLHGGYMGKGEITTKLAWGKYRTYDALAPEFDTYQTIKELANKKAKGELILRYQVDNKYYWVNENQKGPMESAPIIKWNRTFLLIRYVCEEVGAQISWEPNTRTVLIVTKEGKRIEFQIGNNKYKVNGTERLIDSHNPNVVPFIENGRTLIPLRVTGEELNAKEINWYSDKRIAELIFEYIDNCNTDSPFGFCDPLIDNPTKKPNYEYYHDLRIKWLEFPRENSRLGWQSVEKEPGIYDFSQHDKEICEHYQQGINLIYVTRPVNSLYGTSWIEGNGIAEDEYPNGYLTNWANFIKTVAERYDGDGIDDAPGSPIINYYQFVHELTPLFAISDDYWQNHPDQYAEVFELTYNALKEANPNAILSMPVGQLLNTGGENFLRSVLGYLQGKGITDIGFDYHSWDNYKERVSYIKRIKEIASMFGFDLSKIKIFSNESGKPDESGAKEQEQASYLIQAYTVSLANGQTKQFWTRIFDYRGSSGIWSNIGLIHNPLNSDRLSHKKLAYYTYKKMVEVLEGSDWKNIATIQAQDGIYIYKFTKQGKPIWVAWNDNSQEKQVTISGINSSQVKITEAVPKYETGKEVKDYNTAFNAKTKSVINSKASLTLAESPVFIEEK